MTDTLFSPIRLSELENLIKNSVRQAFENQSKECLINPEQADQWFDIEGLRNYLPERPATATIYSWVSNRKIPFVKKGKRVLFLKSDIDLYLKSGRKQTKEQEREALRIEAEKHLESLRARK